MATQNTFLEFRIDLLTEDKSYLGRRIGDILNGIQDLSQNAGSIGSRELTNNAEGIVNQIRRILHTNWPRDDRKHLEALQKAGVAIMQAIEEKGDLASVISDSGNEIEKVLGNLGVKINDIGSPASSEASPEEPSGTAEGQGGKQQEEAPEANQEPSGADQQPIQPNMPPQASAMP